MGVLRQSTARTILIGPVLDSDGAAKTDEVISNIKLTKNGTVAAANGSATLTHDHAGKYKLALTGSDTDTVGVLQVSLSSGTNDMQVMSFNVVEEAVWDALFAASASGYQTPLAGYGARTVVITVQTSGSVAIQGAIVRVTLSGTTYSQTTNSSGQVTFNLDDGTWTVAITKAGYSYAGTTIVVDGDETATYQMTTNSVSAPAAPNLAVGTLTCLGTDGLVEEDVDIVFRMTAGPGTAGYALDSAEFTETSDAAGAIEASFVQGATYTARRGTIGREVTFTAPASASFTLPEALGAP